MCYQIFLSPQVKRCAIITDEHVIHELSQALPKDLRLTILGNREISGKCLNFIEQKFSTQSSCQNEPAKKS